MPSRVANVSVSLSRVFQWYASDFGGTLLGDKRPVLDHIASYLNDDQARDWLAANRNSARIQYQAYDWSLNGISAD